MRHRELERQPKSHGNLPALVIAARTGATRALAATRPRVSGADRGRSSAGQPDLWKL